MKYSHPDPLQAKADTAGEATADEPGRTMTIGPISPRRADTRRNNERILAAAGESLARSEEISFNAIAKEAGVGVGTVYRHFPTSEALILAVYQSEVEHLVEIV